MNTFATILSILETGLKLWQSKEARKYIDEVLWIRRRYYEEVKLPKYIKGVSDPSGTYQSDAVLDNLEHRLRQLGLGFASAVANENAKDMPE